MVRFHAMRNRLVSFFEPPLSRLDHGDSAKLAWVVRLRWIALCAQALSIYPARWPAVVRDHLGEPFATTKVEGLGPGLCYAYTLAAAAGAELQLDDRVGRGAIARIVLPLAANPAREASA